ncbi:MAG: ribonuclease HII [Actinomycetota bacterium]|nr:MAG: ribonuclease HII [Actinomycetota bacterium]
MNFLRPSLAAQLHVERQLDVGHLRFVIGADEVGRGSWAGPLCVGAVLYDFRFLIEFMSDLHKDASLDSSSESQLSSRYLQMNDSKLLSSKQRESLDRPIKDLATGYGLGFVEPGEIDEMGMSRGLVLGLERALIPLADFVDSSVILLDGAVNFSRYLHAKTFIKGDSKSFAIASASIIAKVARDELMNHEAENFPWYMLENNKGYPSSVHVSALHAMGASQIHRKSWSYMANLPWQATIPRLRPQQMALRD